MFLLTEPSAAQINHVLDSQRELPFSYSEVGATRNRSQPPGFPINQFRAELGMGAETYRRAVTALHSWTMYDLDWTTVCPTKTLIKKGEVFATIVKHLGFWSINPCRIVYTFEESDESEKSGFAIGTLPAHSESGEERFTIERNKLDNRVFYDLFAFARAEALLAKLGSPFVRILQKQFAAESYRAMLGAVNKQL